MRKIIAISENIEDNTILGIVVKEPFCDMANNIFYEMGFKPKKQIKDLSIMKADSFKPNALNEFVMSSGLDSDFFTYFICSNNELENMLELIQNDN